jgi:hypothetical protein
MAASDDNTAADMTPVSSQPSQESSLSSKSLSSIPLQQNRGGVSTQESLRRLSSAGLRADHIKGEATSPAQAPVADHIYQHLFFAEEQARREQQQNRIPEVLPRNRRHRSPPLGVSPNVQPNKRVAHSLTKPFPVSSPTREKPVLEAPPCTAQGISIPQSPTFDDGISAISANTLEAMAKQPPFEKQRIIRRVTPQTQIARRTVLAKDSKEGRQGRTPPPPTSNERPSAPFEPPFRAFPSPPRRPSRETSSSSSSPLQVNITPKERSSSTPVRHGTPHSRSTRTSASSGSKSFENWHAVEKQFWESVAQQDDDDDDAPKKHRRSRSSRRSRSNATLSTASSTAPSRTSSWLEKHPHDTVSYEPSDLFFNPRYPSLEEAEI